MRAPRRWVQREQTRVLLILGGRLDGLSGGELTGGMLHDPVRDRRHRIGRERLLDRARLAGKPHIAVLKLMIQAGHFNDLRILVATVRERLTDQREIFLRRHLQIFLAT